ncbi:MAG: hypothetical protein KDE56_01675 [Anaerolineales bacterium]|nr:hypothetical protein [Anaerolineales bacterium]
MFNLGDILNRCKIAVVVITAVFLIYVNVYMWGFTPFTDFEFYWRPDSQLVIRHVPAESIAVGLLEDGDRVEAVEGYPVYRGQVVYPLPLQASYLLTVERKGETLDVDVPFLEQPGALAISYRLPMSILTLAFWVVGTVILYFAQKDNLAALYIGYLFVITGVVTMGTHSTILSVPGAWIWRPFLYVIGVGYLYLGFLPRTKPLSTRTQRLFKLLHGLALCLGIVALWEASVLFPQGRSFADWLSIGLYDLALLLNGLGWLLGFAILVIRTWQMETTYERQQNIILIFLIGLAVVPVVFLTMLPRVLLDVAFLPFPAAILLFLLVPTGYFFVIYRRGFLGLEIIFSRTVIFITLALAMVGVYSSGLFVLQRFVPFAKQTNAPAVLMFLPTLALSIYSSRPINKLVHGLFFGWQIDHTLPVFTAALSSKPEMATLETVVMSLANELRSARAVLVLINEEGYLLAVARLGSVAWKPLPLGAFVPFFKPLLRTAIRPHQALHPLLQANQWMELVLPIMVRGNQVGFWAFSRPDGYFNVEQVRFLERVAEIVAVSSEAIYLFESSRKQSLQLLAAQDAERKRLASMLHDSPLQTMMFVTHKIHSVAADPCACQEVAAVSLQEQVQILQKTMTELREICVGLYPPIIEMGPALVVTEVCRQFEADFGLLIDVDVDLEKTFGGSEAVATAVYRILVEALNNVVKHAEATRATVALYDEGGWLHLVIADDGVGSNLSDVSLSDLIRRQHLGVVGMVEWAKQMKGKLLFAENRPQGTCIRLQLPLEEQVL